MGYLQQLPVWGCMPDRNQSKLLVKESPTAVDLHCMSGMRLMTGLASLESIQSVNHSISSSLHDSSRKSRMKGICSAAVHAPGACSAQSR